MELDRSTQTTNLKIRRLMKNEAPAGARLTDAVGTQDDKDITVTFVFSRLTGGSKVINGKTWYEATGTFTFDPDTLEIAYGHTAKIKIKMNNQGSTNGWKLVTFTPKSNNPAGGPTSHSADANGNIEFDDNNTVAGTYNYGLYLECPSSSQYASSDPSIKQDGGGTPPL